MQKTPRQSATVPESLTDRRGTCRRLPDSVRWCQSPRPGAHLQDTPRQSTTVTGPSGHLQKTPQNCKTVCQTVAADSLRRCQDCLGTSRRLPEVVQTSGAPATVPNNLSDRRATVGD
ncbi:hypothetical protein DPMN_109163 [Dreissena polymorpha]|uniref:Uncharacterized protein n=1 Tax=Dreissena polymorpha TaxID=45954 RepID=A0A9D4QLW6_DREPO|nr:hypothetical protein DPMN_109163 [Dreissena polymorpha]